MNALFRIQPVFFAWTPLVRAVRRRIAAGYGCLLLGLLVVTAAGCVSSNTLEPPANSRPDDVLSCGTVCWVIRIRGDQLIAAHFKGPDWPADSAKCFVKPLR